MQVYYIYKITCTVNGKGYIGYSNNPIRRWAEHKRKISINTVFGAAMKKYGMECFVLEILCCCLDAKYALNVLEPMFIQEHKTHFSENGYNVSLGGDVGRLPWNKGKKGVQEVWNKGKTGCQIAWNKGKKLPSPTQETRKKLSERMTLARKLKHWSSGRKKKEPGFIPADSGSSVPKFSDSETTTV